MPSEPPRNKQHMQIKGPELLATPSQPGPERKGVWVLCPKMKVPNSVLPIMAQTKALESPGNLLTIQIHSPEPGSRFGGPGVQAMGIYS